jgi:glycosyltransferase involved in cell wall biosynthesis
LLLSNSAYWMVRQAEARTEQDGDSGRGRGQKTRMPSGVLFVHNNFPAQFRDLATTLVAAGVPCAALGGMEAPGLAGMRLIRCPLQRGSTPGMLPLAVRAEADLIRGRGAYAAAQALRAEGFDPAVIVGHPGWGETVLLSEVFPDAKQVLFAEFFYKGRGSDIDFDPEFITPSEDTLLNGKTKNAVLALALSDADLIVSPTPFQASLLPSVFAGRVRILHEGVDTDAIRPGPAEPFALDNGQMIQPGTPVITHVNNKLEPLRGLHIFLRALPRLLDEVPDAQVLIVGQPQTRGYGGTAPDDLTWKELCLRGLEGRLDPAQVHFLGRVPHARMLSALKLSTAHVYYSYPFVLSWSVIEAMAAGGYVIGSDTAPLRDAIKDGVNGRLLPFFDVDALSGVLIEACRDPSASAELRLAARDTAVAKFSRTAGRAAWMDVLAEMGLNVSRSGSR